MVDDWIDRAIWAVLIGLAIGVLVGVFTADWTLVPR